MNKKAQQELAELVRTTESMRQILEDLEKEPVRLLCTISRERDSTGLSVPDHRLGLNNYFAEAALRALVAAGLLTQRSGGQYSIYEYEPTDKGREIYERLCAEDACKT